MAFLCIIHWLSEIYCSKLPYLCKEEWRKSFILTPNKLISPHDLAHLWLLKISDELICINDEKLKEMVETKKERRKETKYLTVRHKYLNGWILSKAY